MPARGRKAALKPHTDLIIDLLARFRTDEQICHQLAELQVEITPEDLAPFHAGKYPKMIAARTAKIVAALPIVNPQYRLMALNELLFASDARTPDKLAAIRACISMLKKEDSEPSAEEIMAGEE